MKISLTVSAIFIVLLGCSSPFYYGVSGDSISENEQLISSHPQNQSVAPYDIVEFQCSVSRNVTGYVSYQWQRKGRYDSWWSSVGSNQNNLRITASSSDSGSLFRCIVESGTVVDTSNIATLTVSSHPSNPPVILSDLPIQKTVTAGDSVHLNILVSGADLTFQWERYDSYWKTISETSSSIAFLATTDLNQTRYRCTVRNSYGTVQSQELLLWVQEPNILRRTVTLYNAYSSGASAFDAVEGETVYGSISNETGEIHYAWYDSSRIDFKTINSLGRTSTLTSTLISLNGARAVAISKAEYDSPNQMSLTQKADKAFSSQVNGTYSMVKLGQNRGYVLLKTVFTTGTGSGNDGFAMLEYSFWR